MWECLTNIPPRENLWNLEARHQFIWSGHINLYNHQSQVGAEGIQGHLLTEKSLQLLSVSLGWAGGEPAWAGVVLLDSRYHNDKERKQMKHFLGWTKNLVETMYNIKNLTSNSSEVGGCDGTCIWLKIEYKGNIYLAKC